VSEYQSQFDELARGILLYNSGFDDTFFITKFLGGLKEEIRSVILLHRPKYVDTASALALIQEEELDSCRHKLSVKSTSAPNFRAHQVVEKQKGIETDKLKAKVVKGDIEDKLATLKLYRRKNGLNLNVVRSGGLVTSVMFKFLYMCWKNCWMLLMRNLVTLRIAIVKCLIVKQ
jgi:uncharacterized protein (DUF2235 family)